MNHSPAAVEFSADTLSRSKVFIDLKSDHFAGTIQNAIDKGKINKKDVIGDLSEIISKKIEFDTEAGETVYFHSSGATIEDIAAAISITENGEVSGGGWDLVGWVVVLSGILILS